MNAKRCFLITICLLLSILTRAQLSWYSFAHNQPIAKYRGLQFKLEASVKTDIIDEYASARIWLRLDKNNGYGFFDNMWEKPIRNAQWKTYTIEGKVDDDAENAIFGTLNEFSGNFYYDDFKLSIKNKEGIWETLYQTTFENTVGWHSGISSDSTKGTNNLFTESIVDSHDKDHGKCLKVTGTKVPNYGHNKAIGKYAKVNNINLYYEIYGTGKPLIILHGNGGSISNAEPHLQFFMEKYKVIVIDSRGQGNSIDDSSALNYDLMASDVNQLLEQLQIDSAYVWGHSDGAILALILAKDYPKRISKAIAYAANLTSDTLGLVPAEFERIKKIVETSKNPKAKQLNTMMYKYPNIPFSDLHKISAQVLIMSGDNDMIPLEHTLMIYKNITKSNLCILPGATHGGAWQKPQLFQEIAIDFFEKPFQK